MGEQPQFITAKFDDELEESLAALSVVARAPLGQPETERHRPHLTFAAFVGASRGDMIEELDAFCAFHDPLPIEFRSLACFVPKRVVFASPVVSSELLALHVRLHDHFARPTEFPHHLAPGSWDPHCTLHEASTSREMIRALEAMAAEFDRLSGEIVGFGIVQSSSTDFFQCALASQGLAAQEG